METNPYAPPKAKVADPLPDSHGLKRRSVLMMIVFMFITLGLYYVAWWFRRRPGLNRLDSPRKLALWPLLLFAALFAIQFGLGIVAGLNPDEPTVGSGVEQMVAIYQLAVGIVMIIQTFRVKDMIEDHAAPEAHSGPMFAEHVKLSGLMTFFFSIFYLQWAINRYVRGRRVEGRAAVRTHHMKTRLAATLSFLFVSTSPGAGGPRRRPQHARIRALDRDKTVVFLQEGCSRNGPTAGLHRRLSERTTHRRGRERCRCREAGLEGAALPSHLHRRERLQRIGGRFSFPGTYAVRPATLRAIYMDLRASSGAGLQVGDGRARTRIAAAHRRARRRRRLLPRHLRRPDDQPVRPDPGDQRLGERDERHDAGREAGGRGVAPRRRRRALAHAAPEAESRGARLQVRDHRHGRDATGIRRRGERGRVAWLYRRAPHRDRRARKADLERLQRPRSSPPSIF